MFVRESLRLTAGLEPFQVCNVGPLFQQISADRFWSFVNEPRAQCGQHMPPSDYNVSLLLQAGIDRVTVQLRDPLDALVSWFHHLYRHKADEQTVAWHHPMLVARGLSVPDFYELPPEDAMDSLISTWLPALRRWEAAWAAEARLNVQFIYYEDMTRNPDGHIGNILSFHEVPCSEVKLAPKSPATHYRKGTVGSHKEEMSISQIAKALGDSADQDADN